MEGRTMRRPVSITCALMVAAAMLVGGDIALSRGTAAWAADLQPIQLSKPQMDNPAIALLSKRSSSREFSSRPLPVEVLSNLLWAAWGINRPDGHRTAPSANNRQDIDVYVILPEGIYLYDAKSSQLKPILSGDHRALAGVQPFAKEVPATLVYVSDYSKLGGVSDEMRTLYAGAHTGFISENVYIYCAAQGLATVVRAMVERPALAKAMKLGADQHITLVQSVGYPKKE